MQQISQHRASMAIQLKLDVLLRAVNGADHALIEAEDDDEKALEDLKLDSMKLGQKQKRLRKQLGRSRDFAC